MKFEIDGDLRVREWISSDVSAYTVMVWANFDHLKWWLEFGGSFADAPSLMICSAAAVPSASRRAAITTDAPLLAKSLAAASPMPALAPVTSATFPSKIPMIAPCLRRDYVPRLASIT
jgi:hypothetical protein